MKSRKAPLHLVMGFLVVALSIGFLSPDTRAASETCAPYVRGPADPPSSPSDTSGVTTETGDPDDIEPTWPNWMEKILREMLEVVSQ